MNEVDRAIQAVLKEWPVAVVYVQGHHPEASAYAHENTRVDVRPPYRSNEVARWVGASITAGAWLDRWYQKHPKILRKIAPLLPTIINVLQTADINEIERLFREAEAKAKQQ